MERMRTIYADYENYFFLNYDGDEVLDGCIKGTEVRFVNHSCDPNCHIEKWWVVRNECSIIIFDLIVRLFLFLTGKWAVNTA